MRTVLTKSRHRAVGTNESRLRVTLSPDPEPSELAAWDRLVNTAPGSDVPQLSSWARFRAGYAYESLYLFVLDGDTLLGGAQILYRRLPLIGEVGYVPHGPVINHPGGADSGRRRCDVLDVVVQALTNLARRRFRMLFVQPPRAAHEVSYQLIAHGFRHSTADLAPPGSVHVDLQQSEETLRKKLRKSTRRLVSRAGERGVRVRVGNHDDLGVLTRLMAQTAAHQGFEALSEPYLQRLYTHLAPSGHAALFIGEIGARPVAAELVTMCADTLNNRLGGMDRSDDVVSGVPAIIQWEIIKWGRQQGYHWYDQGGIGHAPLRTLVDGGPDGDPDDGNADGNADSNAWDGADRFKLQFGGTAYRYPTAVELIRPWPVRLAYDLSRRLPGGSRFIQRVTERLRGGRRKRAR